MLKKLFLPIVLSIGLLATPNKAKAYIPIAEIIVIIEAASAIAVAAKPLITMTYKAVKKGVKDVIHFVKRHRSNHKHKVNFVEEENFTHPYTPIVGLENQEWDERVNSVNFTDQSHRYSPNFVRSEEDVPYFGGGF